VPAPPCRTLPVTCGPVAVVGHNHVYFVVGDVSHRRPDVLMRLDVTTSELQRVTADDLAADVADRPRGLILGQSPERGLPTNGYGVGFAVRGARLVPLRTELAPAGRPRSDQDLVSSATRAFDTGTHRELLFRLPGGYDAADEYTAFEWLDDDRLALMNGANSFSETNGDILGCRISTGRCDVLSPGKPGDVRVVPHLPLPG